MSSGPAEKLTGRLLWVHQNFVSARQAGNSRPIHILAALLEAGWQVDVITTLAGYLDSAEMQPQPEVASEGRLTLHRINATRPGLTRRQRGRAYLSFLSRAGPYALARGDVDVIYGSTPPLPQVLLSAALSAWRNVPLILEVRDLWPGRLVEFGLLTSRPVILAMEWLEAFLYRYADHCIAVAPAYVPHLQAMGVRPQDISVILTGSDPVYAAADPATGARWRRRHGLEGTFLLAYTGSMNEYYALEVVLATAERLAEARPDVAWVFAGGGRRAEEVRRASERLECVHYLGPVPRDELPGLYLAADAGLLTLSPGYPLLEGVIPGKLFEYLAAGLPVISMAAVQADQLIELAGAGLVLEQPDADHLADAVLELADMPPDRRRAVGKQGQEWALRYVNAADEAAEVAPAMAKVRRRSRAARLGRFLAAAALACVDVLTRRSRRADAALFGPDRRRTIRAGFQQWFDRHRAGRAKAARSGPPMPTLLSARPRR